MHADNQTTTQINIADEQRNASRDFNEYHIRYFNDPKVLMLSLSEEKLDQLSIESGNNFLYRFKGDFSPNIRRKVIAFKQQHHWTEREVKKLLATGGISVNRRTEEVKLYQERFSYIFGWIVMGLITAYYLLFILLISSATNVVAWKQTLAQLTIAGICAGTLWVFDRMMISPYRLLQRSKAAPLKN